MKKKIFLLIFFFILILPVVKSQEFNNFTNPLNFTVCFASAIWLENDEIITFCDVNENYSRRIIYDATSFNILDDDNVTVGCKDTFCELKGMTKAGSNYYLHWSIFGENISIIDRMTSGLLYSGTSYNLTDLGLSQSIRLLGITFNDDNNNFYFVNTNGVIGNKFIYEFNSNFINTDDFLISVSTQGNTVMPTSMSYNGNNYYMFGLGSPIVITGALIFDDNFFFLNRLNFSDSEPIDSAQYYNNEWWVRSNDKLRIYNALQNQDIGNDYNPINYDFSIIPSLGTLSLSGNVNTTTLASSGTGQIIFSASNFDSIPNYILSQCNKDPINVLYDEFNTASPYDNDWNSGGDTPYYNDFINPQSLQRGLQLFNATFQSQIRHNITPIINSDSEFSYDVYVKDLYNLSGTNTSSSLNVDLQSSGLDLIIHLRYYYDYDNSRICIYTYESEIENIILTDKLILCTNDGSYTDILNLDATPLMEKLYVEGFIDWNIKDFSLRITDADNNKYYSSSLPFRFDDELNIQRINVYADSSDSYSFIDNVNVNDIEEYSTYTFNGESDPFSFICQYPTNGYYTSCLYASDESGNIDTHNNNNCVGVTKVTSALTNATDFLGDDSFLDEIFNVDASSLSTGTKLFYVLISVMITFLFFTVVGVMLGIAPIMLISAVVIVVGELAFFTIIGFIPIWVVILMFILATGIITFTIKRMFFGGNSEG